MRRKIKSSLSAKIFLGIATIVLVVSLLMFAILGLVMPRSYEKELDTQLMNNVQRLLSEMQSTQILQWEMLLTDFAIENQASAMVFDENQQQVGGLDVSHVVYDEEGLQTDKDPSLSVLREFKYEGRMYYLSVYDVTNAQMVEQVKGIFFQVLPYVLAVAFLASICTAFFYTHFLAKPVVEIAQVSQKMANLDMLWRCETPRSDEIGVLAKNLNHMAAKLSDTLQELQTANEKLQIDIEKERMGERRRRDFFTAISHELKTPLTILKGELDGMILNIGKFKNRDKYLQEAYRTSEMIENLVQEMISLAKLDNINLTLEPVILTDMITELSQIYRAMVQDKKIITNYHEEKIIVQADEARLKTAISNIIKNAVTHSPSGQIIDIRLCSQADTIVLTVENSGVHVEQDELLQLWEPFYRTDKSRSRDTGGSGLGLYLVKSILDLHGFLYHLENSELGMKFTIIFPA